MRFIIEESGQGDIEYILLVGGIIVAAIIVYVLYIRLTERSANVIQKSINKTLSRMQNKIETDM